ncbi:hypothetical protein [Nonomuraea sp. NPDC049646]|uniref:hypothetical protein n=1 Tax=unclassified Nonomuraea TaxID=2593643 RepID=UPI0037AFD8B3
MRPTKKWHWATLWALFVLPAVHGCIVWVRQPDIPVEQAYLSWMWAAIFALLLMFEYHQRPDDRDGGKRGDGL